MATLSTILLNLQRNFTKLANIDDDEIMVSFDVVSLFTAIPVDRACEHIRNKLNIATTLKHRTKLSIYR
jgi:hypothetical protein